MGNVLSYKGYTAKIEYSASDNVIFGVVEGLADSISFDSENVLEIESKFHEAVDDYLELCKDIGKIPDKPYKGVFNVRTPPELHRKLAQTALKQDVSLNELVVLALSQFVKTPTEDKFEKRGFRKQNIS